LYKITNISSKRRENTSTSGKSEIKPCRRKNKAKAEKEKKGRKKERIFKKGIDKGIFLWYNIEASAG